MIGQKYPTRNSSPYSDRTVFKLASKTRADRLTYNQGFHQYGTQNRTTEKIIKLPGYY